MAIKFSIYKYCKTDAGWRHGKAAFNANGKIKPNVVLVREKEEKHTEGSYFLNHRNQWVAVGGGMLKAVIEKNGWSERGRPLALRCDNGPEFRSRHFLACGMERKTDLVHIEPGRPVQNAYVKSFHGKLRDECLNANWFWNLFDARAKIGAWKKEYNAISPGRRQRRRAAPSCSFQ